MTTGWSLFVIILTVLNILACLWLLRWTSPRVTPSRAGSGAHGNSRWPTGYGRSSGTTKAGALPFLRALAPSPVAAVAAAATAGPKTSLRHAATASRRRAASGNSRTRSSRTSRRGR